MAPLFSPVRLGNLRLLNRVALEALPSGLALPDGALSSQAGVYYTQRARGGAGLIVFEATYVLPPRDGLSAHLGLYSDAQLFALAGCIRNLHAHGAGALVMLDQPLWLAHSGEAELLAIGAAFVGAAQRARMAGADGVMFSAADGGPFEQLLSPLQNQRSDRYGGDVVGRLRLLVDVAETLARRYGTGFVIGARLNVEEFAPGGLDLREARVIATLLAAAGVNLIEINAKAPPSALVAQFPGWQVPLAAGIKSIVDVPVLVGGLLDDPALANSVIEDRSADLIALGERLKRDPGWPRMAQAQLE